MATFAALCVWKGSTFSGLLETLEDPVLPLELLPQAAAAVRVRARTAADRI
jgi:hypothetical protein